MSMKLGEILYIQKGKKPQSQSTEASDGYLPYVDIKAFEKGIIDNYASTEKSLLCDDGDLLIVCDGSRSGLTGRAIKGVVGSTLAKISADGLTTEYLCYFIQSKYTLLNTQKKGTGIPHLNVEILKSSTITVPSIPEQDRIVSRIEALFSELDKAVEALQTTKKQLAVYRQAVLKETFDKAGEIQTPLNQIIEKPRYGTSKKCSYNLYDNSIPVYRISNINYCNGTIDHNDLKYGSFTENEFENLKLNVGDILIIRSNGSVSLVGRSAIISEKDIHGLFAGYLMRLRIKSEVDVLPQYLNLYLNTHYARTQIERMAKSTSGVNNINSDEICSICLPICDIATQKEMIQEIEIQLSVCDNIEKVVDAALSQAEAVRESVLQQAFEGAL